MCGGINLSQSVGSGASGKKLLKNPLPIQSRTRDFVYRRWRYRRRNRLRAVFKRNTQSDPTFACRNDMLLMGLSMLGWLPWWLTPRMPRFLSSRLGKAGAGKGPLVVRAAQRADALRAAAGDAALRPRNRLRADRRAVDAALFTQHHVPLMLGAGALFSTLKRASLRLLCSV